ncbi:MAG: hypothetical protein V7646_1508 [Pseudonocardia sp.]|jgi:hypothetical protein
MCTTAAPAFATSIALAAIWAGVTGRAGSDNSARRMPSARELQLDQP